jgi:hypothetical protein
VLSDHFGKAFDFDGFWTAASRRFHVMAASQLRLKAGVIELLNVLDDIGLPRAVATSSCREDVQRYLTAYGLLDRFQAVVAQGDYARGKPNPDPVRYVCEAPHSLRSTDGGREMPRKAPRRVAERPSRPCWVTALVSLLRVARAVWPFGPLLRLVIADRLYLHVGNLYSGYAFYVGWLKNDGLTRRRNPQGTRGGQHFGGGDAYYA